MTDIERINAMIERADALGKIATAKRQKKLLLGQIRSLLSRAPDATILGMKRLGRADTTAGSQQVQRWVEDEIRRRGLTVLRVIPGGKT